MLTEIAKFSKLNPREQTLFLRKIFVELELKPTDKRRLELSQLAFYLCCKSDWSLYEKLKKIDAYQAQGFSALIGEESDPALKYELILEFLKACQQQPEKIDQLVEELLLPACLDVLAIVAVEDDGFLLPSLIKAVAHSQNIKLSYCLLGVLVSVKPTGEQQGGLAENCQAAGFESLSVLAASVLALAKLVNNKTKLKTSALSTTIDVKADVRLALEQLLGPFDRQVLVADQGTTIADQDLQLLNQILSAFLAKLNHPNAELSLTAQVLAADKLLKEYLPQVLTAFSSIVGLNLNRLKFRSTQSSGQTPYALAMLAKQGCIKILRPDELCDQDCAVDAGDALKIHPIYATWLLSDDSPAMKSETWQDALCKHPSVLLCELIRILSIKGFDKERFDVLNSIIQLAPIVREKFDFFSDGVSIEKFLLILKLMYQVQRIKDVIVSNYLPVFPLLELLFKNITKHQQEIGEVIEQAIENDPDALIQIYCALAFFCNKVAGYLKTRWGVIGSVRTSVPIFLSSCFEILKKLNFTPQQWRAFSFENCRQFSLISIKNVGLRVDLESLPWEILLHLVSYSADKQKCTAFLAAILSNGEIPPAQNRFFVVQFNELLLDVVNKGFGFSPQAVWFLLANFRWRLCSPALKECLAAGRGVIDALLLMKDSKYEERLILLIADILPQAQQLLLEALNELPVSDLQEIFSAMVPEQRNILRAKLLPNSFSSEVLTLFESGDLHREVPLAATALTSSPESLHHSPAVFFEAQVGLVVKAKQSFDL